MAKSTKVKPPGFLLARLVLFSVGAVSAAFGIAGWIVPELPSVSWAALVLAGLTGLSALVVPVSCEIIGRSLWSILLIPAVIVFGGINAYSFHHAVDALIEEPRREDHHSNVVGPLQAKLAAATAAVAAHAQPAFPDTMGPKNIAARVQAWEAAHKPLIDAEVLARASLTASPAYRPFAPDQLVRGVAIAIDVSLALGLAGLALTSGSIRKRMETTRTKQPRSKRSPKTRPTPAAKYSGFPKLVAANDR